jgi:tetratricopeptide (TPR) repeat protein
LYKGRRGVFNQPSRYLLVLAITSLFGLAPARMLAQAQAPSSQEPQKNWKDRAEYDLYDAITKDTNPKTRLEKLQQWEKQYPKTDYIQQRRTLLLTTYFALNQAKEAVGVAKEILADDPKNFSALYIIVNYTIALAGNPPSADVMDQGEKAANTLLSSIDTPPANFTADQWKAQRPQVEELAHTTIGWVEMQKKNWTAAQDEFQKAMKVDPNSGQLAYYMGTAIAEEKDVKKMPTALFYFARAATYEGQGALNPQGRQQVMDYVKRAYKGYHGSDQDFDKLIAAAKVSPTPPSDIGTAIKSALEMAQTEQQNEEEWNKAHPEEALWKSIKEALNGPDGANYFNTNMKDTAVPTLKGKVVKLEPAVKPKTILVAMEDGKSNGTMADATLKFEAALPGKVDEGTELSFEGVPESYTTSPFMVVFNVDKDKLHGWTGKNAPAAPVHHRTAGATKK